MTIRSHTRSGVLAALLLSGALTLAACADDAADPSGSEAATESASGSGLLPAAEGTTAYPLTLDSPWGSTELDARPERIAALTPSQDDVEILAALGVTPVIASEWTTDVWIEEALPAPIPERFTTGDSQFPVEQIVAADPDLIIVLGADVSDDYDRLASIAPVLSTSQGAGDEGTVANDWESNIRRVGEVLDLEGAAQQVLDTQEQFFADYRAEHPELQGLTASYVVYYGADGGLQYHSSADSPIASVFERMGMALPENAVELAYREEVSKEQLSVIDADVIIFSDNSGGSFADITEQPLFTRLQAVQDDHLILIDNRSEEGTFVIDGVTYQGNLPWSLARSGPLSSTWAVQQLTPALERVLGD